jgi:putative effector of murein hydrolase
MTGICFVVLQPLILRALRVADDDFLTTGLLSGVTSGAIGASGLLTAGKERAAAIASRASACFLPRPSVKISSY